MLAKIIGAIIGSLVRCLDEWITRKQLQEAQTKAEALQGHIESMKEKAITEEELLKIAQSYKKEMSKVKTLDEKLKILKDSNDAMKEN